jgi:uncharacterized membrane protein HdeD (DUF308 family)
VVLGLLVIVGGILCMVAPAISGQAAVLTLGVVLAASGGLELVAGFQGANAPHRSLLAGGGLAALAMGLVLVARPGAGLLALTLLLAAFLFGSGLFATLTAVAARHPGWRWELAFGLVALVLGVTTVMWPISKLWVLATLVGIAIVVRGATMIAEALEGQGWSPAPTTRAA